MLRSRLAAYGALMRLDRPVGTLLLLWPTLAALWIAAEGVPDWPILLAFTGGTFVMRAAGCVANDIADRNFDRHVDRTRNRPLATGQVAVTEAVVLLLLLGVFGLAIVLTLNLLTLAFAAGGVVIALIYPLMKRVTYLPQVVLGAAFSWGIPMSFTAITNALPEAAWLMFTASLLWIVAYDTQYAMVDRRDDIQVGIKSTAILFGSADTLMIGVLQFCAWLLFLLLGFSLEFQHAYFVALAAIAGLFGYQQRLMSDRDREQEVCFAAFRNNTWVGFALFAGVVLEYALDGSM
ncbi:MAG: 4-hydroxybenzoate octaprenyltransferase [Gammaproteobacteria bacterium]|nr:4-hydroxybenzoate octaprenyltransferase [Gammaproteobacteria bacterium]